MNTNNIGRILILINATLLVAVCLLVPIVCAIPTTGVAYDITSNSFTVPVTGVTGDGWIAWGQSSGNNNWASQTETGDGNYVVWGAPIIGGKTIYYKACDSTGCGSERTLDILTITPMPTSNFGAAYNNLSARHFQINDIPRNLLPGYTYGGTPLTLLWSIMFACVFFGVWLRTRSVKLTLMLGFLFAEFIVSTDKGLFLGSMAQFQIVAQGLILACIAGVGYWMMRKS